MKHVRGKMNHDSYEITLYKLSNKTFIPTRLCGYLCMSNYELKLRDICLVLNTLYEE